MKASISSLTLPAAANIGTSPLPVFRDRNHHKAVRDNGTLLPEEQKLFGFEAGYRILPYLTQDQYSRTKTATEIKTVVLDNGLMRATFLPGFGGRLYSLKDLSTGKELLFKNPVLQPANLAIRNAWFSGGIEWNIGQFGHTFTTCSPVFFARLTDEEGNEFLRMYEFERQKRVFWQIDFHLPRGSRSLQATVRIVNDRTEPTPMYWWTNIALPESKDTRVFSATDHVIYEDSDASASWLKQHGLEGAGSIHKAPAFFGHAELPKLSDSSGDRLSFDASYPQNFQAFSEYFFQNPDGPAAPWEAAVQRDGSFFLECSTPPLTYRKMFCWGTHRGGRKWCDFLSEKGRGDYVEIQAGIAPTQVHGYVMPAQSDLTFTQLFTCSSAAPDVLYGPYESARAAMAQAAQKALPAKEVFQKHQWACRHLTLPPEELLSIGSGWGALEKLRREKACEDPVPDGFSFPQSTLGQEQIPWVTLLKEGNLPDAQPCSPSFQTAPEWENPLRACLQKTEKSVNALNHLGVLLYEKGQHAEAQELWNQSIRQQPTPLAYFCLAKALEEGCTEPALAHMKTAFTLNPAERAYAKEYLAMLTEHGRFEAAFETFEKLEESCQANSRIRLLAAIAAAKTGRFDFVQQVLEEEHPDIREGETTLTDLWYCLAANRLAWEKGEQWDESHLQQARETLTPPKSIDFRMVQL